MTVNVSSGTIKLQGACTVEDAEALLQQLLIAPNARVEWSACESAHSAVVQVLLAGKVLPVGTPLSVFLRDIVGPALRN